MLAQLFRIGGDGLPPFEGGLADQRNRPEPCRRLTETARKHLVDSRDEGRGPRGEADRVFHFAGGLHHALRERASGFCYVNDAVLAILRLRERGLRVAYVDIDAHHGDGVQYAFYGDPHVLTISTHERGERLFPGTGFVHELGEGDAAGFSVNLPLEAYTDTQVYLPAFEAVVPPLLARFKPDVIVAQRSTVKYLAGTTAVVS